MVQNEQHEGKKSVSKDIKAQLYRYRCRKRLLHCKRFLFF